MDKDQVLTQTLLMGKEEDKQTVTPIDIREDLNL